MKKVIVRAPVRADLAGGTLDLWPLYLFHPGARTVNVAVAHYAESEVVATDDDSIRIHLTDQQYRQQYESMHELGADPKAALIFRAVEHFHLTGVHITTRTDAPRGSGLGGSSALAITLVRALSEIAGNPIDGDALINLVRDLETRLLGIPAGIQDYYPPVYGGLASLHLNPGAPVHHPIALPIGTLAEHMLLHYTGIAHFSGTNNWEMYKRQIEGKKKVQKGFARIAEISIEMERALTAGNFEAAGRALADEWENRKALIEGISTPEIDSAIDAAVTAGAWGGKICGAGGGGCIVFLHPPEKRESVLRALATVPGRVLDAAPVAHGLTIDRGDDGSMTITGRGRLPVRFAGASVEQLYVYGGNGDYRPFLLAEGVVTHSESRSGVHLSAVRAYVAPIEPADGKVQWDRATSIDPEKLDIRAVPDPARRIDVGVTPEALVQSAAQAEDGFKQFVEETETLRIYSNPAFVMYSNASESREAFLERCFEEARRRLNDESERLESTFRRRIDQLRERAEREDREAQSDENAMLDDSSKNVGVAWGQALYNITSGRPAAVSDSASNIREVDYLENIAQIQRAWDKELETLRDELMASARSIEEIEVAPSARNIEVTKYLILWATALP